MISRIILTTNYSPWSSYSGGGQRSTHHIAEYLSNYGYDVHVVYSKTFLEKIAVPENINYKVHWASFPGLKSKRNNWLRSLSVLKVRNIMNKILIPGCIVHSNGEEGALIPTLKKTHDFTFVATPRYPHLPDEIRDIKPTLRNSFSHPSKSKYLLLHRMLQQADLITTTSQFAKKMYVDTLQLSPQKFEIVPNGVAEEFLNIEPSFEQSRNIIFFGRLSPSKGVDTLLKAAKIASDHFNKLIIIGRGEMEKEIKDETKSGKLAGRIQLLPWMNIENLIQYIRSSDIAVLPSREESFGNSIAESMACGTPVITSNVGSIPEIITNKNEGLLIDPENYQEFAEAIIRMMNHPEKRKRVGLEGRKRIHENFTWKRVTEQFIALYENCVAEC